MSNTHAVHQNDLVLGRAKHTTPQSQKNWFSAIIEGLKSGRAALHTYSRLRAQGVPAEEANQIVVNEYFNRTV